jgi:hypothetical protein
VWAAVVGYAFVVVAEQIGVFVVVAWFRVA